PPALPFNVVSIPLAGGAIGATQIALPGSDFFPEGIAAAPDGTLFVGSVPLGTIVRIAAGSTTPDADEFVEASVARRGVTGITVGGDILWFCDSTLPPGPGGGDIVGVDLQTGVEVVRHAMPDPVPAGGADAGLDAGVVGVGGGGGVDAGVGDAGVVGGADAGGGAGAPAGPTTFCNDLIVASDGDLFATDSTGRVFRVDAADVEVENSASVWLEHPAITTPGGFGANGIEQVGDNLIIAANGTLVAVDPESDAPASTLQVLTLSEGGAAVTLCGPDGLQAVPARSDQLVVVENGFCDAARERVVRVTLSGLD
ncbi:MAG TPA: hypothetical protein VNN80_12535, partial [Polyangiaceae bacterium]|nr:hypothetical protein [Polyangiaceae bacterium]